MIAPIGHRDDGTSATTKTNNQRTSAQHSSVPKASPDTPTPVKKSVPSPQAKKQSKEEETDEDMFIKITYLKPQDKKKDEDDSKSLFFEIYNLLYF